MGYLGHPPGGPPGPPKTPPPTGLKMLGGGVGVRSEPE